MLNQNFSASNCLAYPTPSGRLTAPPSGYVPVHISHYGRHGSRYLLSDNDYLRPLRTLERADSAGALTERVGQPWQNCAECMKNRIKDGANLHL